MSIEYDLYLQEHKTNVKKAFDWLRDNLSHLICPIPSVDYEWQIGMAHDDSKTDQEEYDAYDAYFYGNNKSFEVVENFNKAWLHHIHMNPHHWQHWILIQDDNKEEKIFEMPYNYVIEMICDWWSFSWKTGDLKGINKWYDEHKSIIRLHPNTRKLVENILAEITNKLDEGMM